MMLSSHAQAVGTTAWFGGIADEFPELRSDTVAVVHVSSQQLSVFENGEVLVSYPVSTSRYGIGSEQGSQRTPVGLHYVRKKFGDDSLPGTVFRGRVDAGFIVDAVQEPVFTSEDYVTTRILWLSGLEPGVNEGEGIDSFNRYIYIHGTHEEGLIGQPASHGCIRMKNDDVIELYQKMPLYSLVMILP